MVWASQKQNATMATIPAKKAPRTWPDFHGYTEPGGLSVEFHFTRKDYIPPQFNAIKNTLRPAENNMIPTQSRVFSCLSLDLPPTCNIS